jgi:hypothetical protein
MSTPARGGQESKRSSGLRKMPDAQLRALGDGEFWNAIEPEGLCPGCDPRLAAEVTRRNARGPLN